MESFQDENVFIFCKKCHKNIEEINITLNNIDKLICKICGNKLESETIILSEFL